LPFLNYNLQGFTSVIDSHYLGDHGVCCLFEKISKIINDHFSGVGRAISPMCEFVCMCLRVLTITFERNDLCPE